MKNYDGREKSLLRGAVKDMLPEPVAWRVKSLYPSTQNPNYVRELQRQAKEQLIRPHDELFALVDRVWLEDATGQDPAAVARLTRLGLERTLDLAMWMEIYHPDLRLP
jgi:asparagine synthase (glutamine-hydrolysing)